MKRAKTQLTVLAMLIAVLGFVLPTFAQTSAEMVVSFDSIDNIEVGDTLTATVEVQPGTDAVNAAELHFEFDNSLLQVNALSSGSTFPVGVIGPNFDNDAGTIDYAAGVFNTSVNAPFTLLNIEFTAIAEGTTTALSQATLTSKVTTANGQNVLNTVTFPADITINAPDLSNVLYRVNVGGSQQNAADGSTPVWSADTNGNPSAFRTTGGTAFSVNNTNTIDLTDPSVANGPAPEILFRQERYGPMDWDFPVTTGDALQINLYFAEIFLTETGNNSNDAKGPRVFDVSIEGGVPFVFDDIDQFEIAGHDAGFMVSYYVQAGDDNLDLELIAGIENPNLKGIEIISYGSTVAPPTLVGLPDQNRVLSEAPQTINLNDSFSDDGNLTFTVDNGDPSVVNITQNGAQLLLEWTAVGTSEVVVTATDDDDLNYVDAFVVNVSEPLQPGDILFRINAGGNTIPAIDAGPDWIGDSVAPVYHSGQSTTGSFDNDNGSDSTVPATTPNTGGAGSNIFVTERYDNSDAAPPMMWDFPAPNGLDVEVRIYFHSGWNGADQVGERQFDVTLEDTLVLDDFDIVAEAGHRTGTMRSFVVTSDGNIDLDFAHGPTQNPVLSGIEIIVAGEPNDLPVLDVPTDQTNTEGDVVSLQLTATDDDTNLTFDASNLPAGLSISTDGLIDGTIADDAAANSPYTVIVIVEDGVNPAVGGTFTWTVEPGNESPVVDTEIPDVTVTEGDDPQTITLTDFFSDPDVDDTLTFQVTNNTDTSVVTTGIVDNDLTLTFGAVGTADITVEASDGDLSVTDTFTVNVVQGNLPPVVDTEIPDVTVTEGDDPQTITLTDFFSDPDVDDTLTFQVTNNTDTSVVTTGIVDNDLTLTFGAVGTADITVEASDGDLSVTDTFTVNVVQGNVAPIVQNAIPAITDAEVGDLAFTIDLLTVFDDADLPDDTLTFTVSDVTTAGIVDATISGSTLTVNFLAVGSTSVEITATDLALATAVDAFEVVVVESDTVLSISKTGPETAFYDMMFTYELTVANDGTAEATNVVVTDPLPTGAAFVSAAPGEPTCVEASNEVTCTIASIAAGQSETITVQVMAQPSITAYPFTASNQFPFPSTLTLNAGPMPENFIFVSIAPTEFCNYDETTRLIACNFGVVPGGESRTATLEVSTYDDDTIFNTATAGADNAPTVASNTITTDLTEAPELEPSALVEINPGGGLGASTYGNSSYQITNTSEAGVTIENVTIDLSTGILPDMVFDPVGAGGDATSSCLTPNNGATATGFVAPGDPCVDPFSQPRQGGFDILSIDFNEFDTGEQFFFTVDIDPNSIQGVPGAGNAGAVSGYELIGATITVTFNDGVTEQVIVSNLYEDGSLGGSQAVVANGAPAKPGIELVGYAGEAQITVNDLNQTVEITGTPGANISLLQMDSRLFIANNGTPFNVADETYYANEAMSGKTLYTGVIPQSGVLNIPVTLLVTPSGNGTPDGGLNQFIAVLSEAPYAVDTQVSQTSNVLTVLYNENFVEPGLVFTPDALDFSVEVDATDSATFTVDANDDSTPTGIALDVTYTEANVPAWLSVPATTDEGLTTTASVDATGMTAGTYTATVTATLDGYTGALMTVTLEVTDPVVTDTDGEALVAVTPNGDLFASTFGNNSYQISNVGQQNITSVSIDLSTVLFPDIVFDPVGDAGDSGAKCLTTGNGGDNQATVGLTVPGNGGNDAADCELPFTNPNEGGYYTVTLDFTDFNPGESYYFGLDVDPTSIKTDPNTGDAGAVSGLEMSGATVTVTFADGATLTSSLFGDGSDGGSAAYVASTAPTAPSIAVDGVLTSPAEVPDLNQTVLVTGEPNSTVTLLHVDARMYIDTGIGFDIEAFEANEALDVNYIPVTLDANGEASVPVTLLQTTSPNAGPDGGINHFIAVTEGTGTQNSQTSNLIVLEYNPDANTDPALTITPPTLEFVLLPDATDSATFVVGADDASTPVGINLSATTAPWLTIPTTSDAGTTETLSVDTTDLTPGEYTATVTASLTDYIDATMTVSLTVLDDSVADAICINAGGAAYTTVADGFFDAGIEFLADNTNPSAYFDGGSKVFSNNSIQLTNSINDPLFTTERSATANLVPFNFALDVDPGQYLVEMWFADIYFGATGGGGRNPNDGQRVFDLTVEGVLLLDDYDLNAELGEPETVVEHETVATVNDGTLDINFTPSVDQAKISALCITPLSGGVNQPPTISTIPNATVTEGDTFSTNFTVTNVEADDVLIVTADVVQQGTTTTVPATLNDSGNGNWTLEIPTTTDAGGEVYAVTITADDSVNPAVTEEFTVTVSSISVNNPSAEILITDNNNSYNDVSTFGNSAFEIINTGDVDITSIFFDVSSTYMPDVVFDPSGTAGDTAGKCFTPSTSSDDVGVDASNPCTAPFSLPNVTADDGYFGMTINFSDFNPNENFLFGVDMDPNSIKGDNTAGGSGGISGLEMIGGTVTITFADNTVITAPIWLDPHTNPDGFSNAGGRVIVAQNAPTPAPTINMVGLNTPTTTADNTQVIQITGPANQPYTLLQVDGRLHIDPGSANGNWPNGYDIEPFEANESVGKAVYTGNFDANGFASVPVVLLQSPNPYTTNNNPDAGPGGINHFIAVVNGTNGQTSGASNVIVVEYDPDTGDNLPPVVINPGNQTDLAGSPITPLAIGATGPEPEDTLTYAATNLPPGLEIDANSGIITGTPGGGSGAFVEQDGIVVVEMESADSLPNNWETIDTYSTSFSPNVNNPLGASNDDFIIWQAGQSLGNPGNGLVSYDIQIDTPGTYRFIWRNQVGNGTNTTEHNDTWLRINADSFYGQQGGGSIVCPNGSGPTPNDCTGSSPEGSSSNGWFKVYSSGANNWSWSTNTSDNDAHQIFARFDAPGVYTIEISARSSSHAIDRMVLYNTSEFSQSQAQNLNLPESPRSSAGTYNVEVTVTDDGSPQESTAINFAWTITSDGGGDPNVAPTAVTGTYGPIADTNGVAGESLQLDGSASSDSDGTIASYAWTVNGTPYTGVNPTVALNDGVNTVSLTVTDDDGAQDTANTTITVEAPTTGGTCGALVQEAESGDLDGFNIISDGTASGGAYIEAPASSGNSYSTPGADTATFCFTVTEAGTYQISAIVFAPGGDNNSFWVSVNGEDYLWDTPEIASYTQDYVADRNGADPVQIELTPGEVTVVVALREPQTRLDQISLELIDGGDPNVAPTAVTGTYGPIADTDGVAGESLQLDGSASSDSDGTIASYEWTVNGTDNYTGASPTVDLNDGVNTVSLTVTDDDGAQNTANTTITVEAPTTGGTCGALVQEAEDGDLSGDFVVNNSNAASDGQYILADGGSNFSINTSENATYCFAVPQAGDYDLILTVNNNNDGNDNSFYISVNGSAPVVWQSTPQSGFNAQTVDTYTLPAGEIEVVIYIRENGMQLDVLELASVGGGDPNVAPTAVTGTYGPIADTDGVAGESLQLDGSASSDSDGTIASYEWTVNGTDNYTGATPTVDLNDGVNTVSLTVTDNDGAQNTANTTITVEAPIVDVNDAPTAVIANATSVSDTNGVAGENVTLDPTGSNDSDGSIVSYVWTVNGVEYTGANPTVPMNDGANTVSLTVTDDDGAQDTANTTITVEAPTTGGGDCGALVQQAENADLDGFVTGTGNGASGQYIEAPASSGNSYSAPGADTATFCFTVTQAGTYQIAGTVRAIDGDSNSFWVSVNGANYLWDNEETSGFVRDYVSARNGADPVQLQLTPGEVTVVIALREPGTQLDILELELVSGGGTPTNQPPTAVTGTYGPINDSNGVAGEQLTLNGGNSSDSDGNIVSYAWTVNGTDNYTGVSPQVTLNDGVNTVSLTVTDDDGAQDTANTTITVNAPVVDTNVPPTAVTGTYGPIADSNGVAGEQLTLNGGNSSDSDGNIVSYAWTVNGTQYTGVNPTVALNDGVNTVSLTVTDDDGATGNANTTITVEAPVQQTGPAVVSFTLIDATTNGEIGQLVNNATLDVTALPVGGINVRANTDPATVSSVNFSLTGPDSTSGTEGSAPYALYGDSGGNYNPWTPALGNYTLTATPFVNGVAGTPLTINFSVVTGGVTPPPSDLITNLSDTSSDTYVLGTATVGELVYVDRAYTFVNVPAMFAGQEYIATANDDKTATAQDLISFTLTADATVYVLWDSRFPVPAWLSGWTLEAAQIVTTDFNNTQLARNIYSLSFSAGQVTLPGAGLPGNSANYSVIAVPQASGGMSASSVTVIPAAPVTPITGSGDVIVIPTNPEPSGDVIVIPGN